MIIVEAAKVLYYGEHKLEDMIFAIYTNIQGYDFG